MAAYVAGTGPRSRRPPPESASVGYPLAGGQQVLVATHCARAYADSLLAFNINRDNPFTSGYALICVSGYLEPL
jgi:hypothetical protein